MAVKVNLVNKHYVELRDEYNAADVWKKIQAGEELELRSYGSKIIINPANVTNVHEERSSF